MVDSGEPLARSWRSDFFLSRRLCELRRRRLMKTDMMRRRSVVAADAERSRQTMKTLGILSSCGDQWEKTTLASDELAAQIPT